MKKLLSRGLYCIFSHIYIICFSYLLQKKDGYNYECDVMQLFEFGSLHHDYYLVNIRVPVEPYKGVNMGIGKLTGMTLVVCINKVIFVNKIY